MFDFHVCTKCPYGDEAGMCESRGAKWKGEWKPTNECIPKNLNEDDD